MGGLDYVYRMLGGLRWKDADVCRDARGEGWTVGWVRVMIRAGGR